MNLEDKINLKRVDKLLLDIHKTSGVGNVCFHMFQDGRLYPIRMEWSPKLDQDLWAKTHRELKVYLKGDPVLEKILNGQTVYIYDAINDPEASPAFKAFGIKSLVVFPLMDKENKIAIGLICVPDLFEPHVFTKEIIDQCEDLVREFNKDLLTYLEN